MSRLTVVTMLAFVLVLSGCATVERQAMPEMPVQVKGAKEMEFSLPVVPEEETAQGKPSSQTVYTEIEQDEEYLILNFENTELKTIISTFAELLEFNYILSPGVGGSVTIQSYKRIPTSDLFQIFQSILEVNGLTAVKVGGFYHIIPIEQARTYPLDVEKGPDVDFTLDSSFVTQIVPLQNVKAADVANNILKQLMPRGVHLIVYEPANMLVLTARPETLQKFMHIIEALDLTEGESNVTRTFVYYIENGEAVKLQDILTTVYLQDKTTSASPAPSPAPIRLRTVARPAAAEDSLPAELGELNITAYEDINALIIKATPRSYLALLDVLKKIDVPPKQVLIDVMIAEISLTDALEYGLEWFLRNNASSIGGVNFGGLGAGATLTTPPTVPSPTATGFSFAAAGTLQGDSFNTLFTMLETYSDLNILASPSILAMDNKEAEIKIGNEVPTATGVSQGSVTTQTNIQYKTVGNLLNVTPHITEKGNVSMKISIESSSIGEDQVVGGQSYPAFNTRSASTSAVVKDDNTLILGGIIYNRKVRTRRGVPGLSKLPIIGGLFGGHSMTSERRELLLMVTPHVVSNNQEALELTEKYQKTIRIIKRNMDMTETVLRPAGRADSEIDATEPNVTDHEPEATPTP